MTQQAREALEKEAIRKINRLPCPICGGIEGCDHTVSERLRAFEDASQFPRLGDTGAGEVTMVNHPNRNKQTAVKTYWVNRVYSELTTGLLAHLSNNEARDVVVELARIWGQIPDGMGFPTLRPENYFLTSEAGTDQASVAEWRRKRNAQQLYVDDILVGRLRCDTASGKWVGEYFKRDEWRQLSSFGFDTLAAAEAAIVVAIRGITV